MVMYPADASDAEQELIRRLHQGAKSRSSFEALFAQACLEFPRLNQNGEDVWHYVRRANGYVDAQAKVDGIQVDAAAQASRAETAAVHDHAASDGSESRSDVGLVVG